MPLSWALNAAAAWTSGSRTLFCAPATQIWKPSALETLQLGVALPRPHPPEPLVCATAGPAHFPLEKPQQPCWHSESLAHSTKTVFLFCWLAASWAADWPAVLPAAAPAPALLPAEGALGVKGIPLRFALNAAPA